MKVINKEKAIRLLGIDLGRTTSNLDNQSAKDCGALWQKFETEQLKEKIPGKKNDDVYAVYYDYEGDHTKPFRYFIGCKVGEDVIMPAGLEELKIPAGLYALIIAKGKMPDCIANAWKSIWSSNIKRAYNCDFEVYDQRSKNWDAAEVDLYISVKD